jgi:hypothetical protein
VTRFNCKSSGAVSARVDQKRLPRCESPHLDILTADVVNQATGRSDQDVKGTASHRGKLRRPRDSAVGRDRFDARRTADGFELFEDLHRQLTGRGNDQSDWSGKGTGAWESAFRVDVNSRGDLGRSTASRIRRTSESRLTWPRALLGRRLGVDVHAGRDRIGERLAGACFADRAAEKECDGIVSGHFQLFRLTRSSEDVHQVASAARNWKSLALDRGRLCERDKKAVSLDDSVNKSEAIKSGGEATHGDKVLGLDVVTDVVGQPRLDPARDGLGRLPFDRDVALLAPLFHFGLGTLRHARVLLVKVLQVVPNDSLVRGERENDR